MKKGNEHLECPLIFEAPDHAGTSIKRMTPLLDIGTKYTGNLFRLGEHSHFHVEH